MCLSSHVLLRHSWRRSKASDFRNMLTAVFFFFLFSESDFPQDPSVLAPSSWNTSGHGKYAHARTHARSITFFQHKLLTHLLQEINNDMLTAPLTDGGFHFNSTCCVKWRGDDYTSSVKHLIWLCRSSVPAWRITHGKRVAAVVRKRPQVRSASVTSADLLLFFLKQKLGHSFKMLFLHHGNRTSFSLTSVARSSLSAMRSGVRGSFRLPLLTKVQPVF